MNWRKILHSKKAWLVAGIIAIAILAVALPQAIITAKAHETFEGYYAFRGCAQLIEKTDTYGICKTTSGDTIKIVKYNNEWYLDGDLPLCWWNICP